MKYLKTAVGFLLLACLLAACGEKPQTQAPTAPTYKDITKLVLADDGITENGNPVGTDSTAAVYTARDIVYYEAGKDFTYGEGSEKDAHTPEEAAAHTVLHITQPGAYSLSGKLSLGQIAVDLGDSAKDDPTAVVTLVLEGVDITCDVAPAVIFYNVYECGNGEAAKDVDTSAAGANVVIADGTVNTVSGSYVERIYKPDTVVLNEDKTKVEDAKKLHKYDGAFYSKRSMNIFGDTGTLNIHAENEGLDSEMHLTVNGGNIHITSGNDGINTNEDGLSVTTVNGGSVTVLVTGDTGEGDGIDSNGYLVINGGTVIAAACSDSADAGIDSDMGIHIHGGTVIATGHMLDRIENGGQNYAVFQFAQTQTGKETVTLKDPDGKVLLETTPENAYSVLIYSSPELKAGTYTLWRDGTQLAGSGGMMGGPGMRPESMERPEGTERPEGMERPGNMQPPADFTPPEGGVRPEKPAGDRPEGFGGERPQDFGGNNFGAQALTPDFVITDGGAMFRGISLYDQT